LLSHKDWYSQINVRAMTRMLTERHVTMSEPTLVPNPDNADEVAEAEEFCDFYRSYIPPGSNCMEPMATIYYPILSDDKIDTEIEIYKSPGYPEAYDVKAVIALDFYWKAHLQDLLPASATGIIVVFENESSNATFTYRIEGPATIYLGVGDHHDLTYDSLAVHTSTGELQSFMLEDDHYIGLPFDYETCSYRIHVYPSDDMKDRESYSFQNYCF
jgi:hypothetical protein